MKCSANQAVFFLDAARDNLELAVELMQRSATKTQPEQELYQSRANPFKAQQPEASSCIIRSTAAPKTKSNVSSPKKREKTPAKVIVHRRNEDAPYAFTVRTPRATVRVFSEEHVPIQEALAGMHAGGVLRGHVFHVAGRREPVDVRLPCKTVAGKVLWGSQASGARGKQQL